MYTYDDGFWNVFSDFDRLLDSVGRNAGANRRGTSLLGDATPALNVWGNDEALVVTSEIPGVDPASVGITVHGDTLTVKGKRVFAPAQEKQPERSAEFQRSIQTALPHRCRTHRSALPRRRALDHAPAHRQRQAARDQHHRLLTPPLPQRTAAMSSPAPSQTQDQAVATARNGAVARPQPVRIPAVSVRETEQAIVLEADLPGVSLDQVEITIDQDVLTLRGTVAPAAHDGYRLLHREYADAGFARSFTVPEGIDRQQVAAVVKNGVLTLTLPKQQATQPRRIAVQNG